MLRGLERGRNVHATNVKVHVGPDPTVCDWFCSHWRNLKERLQRPTYVSIYCQWHGDIQMLLDGRRVHVWCVPGRSGCQEAKCIPISTVWFSCFSNLCFWRKCVLSQCILLICSQNCVVVAAAVGVAVGKSAVQCETDMSWGQ